MIEGNVKLKCFVSGLFLFLAVCVGAWATPMEFTGSVVGIVDGDTIDVMRDGKAVRVRLWGIDTPERNQAFGTRAKQFTVDYCFQKVVTVRVNDLDRNKRLVAEVALPDGSILNHELVRTGLAWWYKKYAPRDTLLKTLQAEAQQKKAGLWQDASPIPPWEFRHRGQTRRKDFTFRTHREDASTIVFITESGSRYHRRDCSTIKSNKKAVTLGEAEKKGLTPCRVCRP